MLDVTAAQKSLGIPFTRLHDCGWPNPSVVDHHVVFPNPAADPGLPESYDFRLTDEYIAAVRLTGSEPVYRLGESIEHTTVKRYAHPPADMEKWAAVCRGIIRHYNAGWAHGFHHNIRYWEIWNEPENRPACWSGTDDDYLRLYRVAALSIKKEFPEIMIGGPALGASGSLENGVFKPTDFARNFVVMCRRDNVPLDFFSWHCYTSNPSEISQRAVGIRQFLVDAGFQKTESHLNEWNYLPGNSWQPGSKESEPAARQAWHEEMTGAAGAAFAAATLIELQDAPADVCNFFHGEVGGFGMFTEHGAPNKVHEAFLAFHGLLETPERVQTRGARPGRLAFAAGLNPDGRAATLLVSSVTGESPAIILKWKNLPWPEATTAEIRIINATSGFTTTRTEIPDQATPTLTFRLEAPAIAFIRLRPSIKSGAE
ncbi:MAG: hypothetical protein JWL81_1991 [Verrucomicrobiales bacterium]|nr:hypothetical protein [Verrucomicrobiales bacterium]